MSSYQGSRSRTTDSTLVQQQQHPTGEGSASPQRGAPAAGGRGSVGGDGGAAGRAGVEARGTSKRRRVDAVSSSPCPAGAGPLLEQRGDPQQQAEVMLAPLRAAVCQTIESAQAARRVALRPAAEVAAEAAAASAAGRTPANQGGGGAGAGSGAQGVATATAAAPPPQQQQQGSGTGGQGRVPSSGTNTATNENSGASGKTEGADPVHLGQLVTEVVEGLRATSDEVTMQTESGHRLRALASQLERARAMLDAREQELRRLNEQLQADVDAEIQARRTLSELERAQLNLEKDFMAALNGPNCSPTDVVSLNVGGRTFVTYRSTLRKVPGSFLDAMFSGRHEVQRVDGAVFLDRNPEMFEMILDWLRQEPLDRIEMPSDPVQKAQLTHEIEFFGLNKVRTRRGRCYTELVTPRQVIGGTEGQAAGSFKDPCGVAVDKDGNVVVADRNNHRIQVLTRDGQLVRMFGTQGSGPDKFSKPWGVTVDLITGSGNIIVADCFNHCIKVHDPNGKHLWTFGSEGSAEGQFKYPCSVAVTKEGNLVVCDYNNHRLQVLSPTGRVLRTIGSRGNGDGQFQNPRGVTLDHDGNIICADMKNARVQVLTVTGEVLMTFGSHGPGCGQFDNPRGVAVDAEGNLLVVDANKRLQVFTSQGVYLHTIPVGGDVAGLVIDQEGFIMLAEASRHRISIY